MQSVGTGGDEDFRGNIATVESMVKLSPVPILAMVSSFHQRWPLALKGRVHRANNLGSFFVGNFFLVSIDHLIFINSVLNLKKKALCI